MGRGPGALISRGDLNLGGTYESQWCHGTYTRNGYYCSLIKIQKSNFS